MPARKVSFTFQVIVYPNTFEHLLVEIYSAYRKLILNTYSYR